MKLSKLEEAPSYEVKNWLKENLQLTPYQCELIDNRELLRFSGFYYYKTRKKQKVSFLWRFTLLVYPLWFVLLVVFSLFKFLATGSFGYGSKFLDKYLRNWQNKLNL